MRGKLEAIMNNPAHPLCLAEVAQVHVQPQTHPQKSEIYLRFSIHFRFIFHLFYLYESIF